MQIDVENICSASVLERSVASFFFPLFLVKYCKFYLIRLPSACKFKKKKKSSNLVKVELFYKLSLLLPSWMYYRLWADV